MQGVEGGQKFSFPTLLESYRESFLNHNWGNCEETLKRDFVASTGFETMPLRSRCSDVTDRRTDGCMHAFWCMDAWLHGCMDAWMQKKKQHSLFWLVSSAVMCPSLNKVATYFLTYLLTMHGCMDSWMHGCKDAWMHGYTDARMHGCTDARIHGCTDARMHGSTDARMHGCTDAQMHGCTDAWMHGCIDAWMHGCMDAWMYGCKDEWWWMHGWIDAWMDVLTDPTRNLLARITVSLCSFYFHKSHRKQKSNN